MKIPVIDIGNSKGIRLPKAILQQVNLTDKAELEVRDGRIILSPARNQPRQNWAAQFAAAGQDTDDTIQIDDHSFDRDEWTW